MSVIDTVKEKLESHLAELAEEEQQLRSALGSLGGTKGRKSPGSPRTASPAPQASPKRKGRKLAKRGQRKAELLSAIRSEPGITVAGIVKRHMTDVSDSQVHALAKQAVADGTITKDGVGYSITGIEPPKEPKTKSKAKARKAKAPKSSKGASKGETKEPVAA